MRSSVRSTSARRARGAGFSLLEVIIAATLFSVVVLIALQGINESTEASRLAIAQADLRRIGDGILEQISRDLRSTQARWCGGDAHRIQFYRVTRAEPRFDITTGYPLAEGGNDPVIYEYAQRSTASTLLTLNFAARSSAVNITNGTNALAICRELAVAGDRIHPGDVSTITGGFNITPLRQGSALGFPVGLLSANAANIFADVPTTLRIELILKRRLGKRFSNEPGTAGDWNAFAALQTDIQLKASGNY
jgi:prepilin-type N-terminal cleavage/methylation domain-containing protein